MTPIIIFHFFNAKLFIPCFIHYESEIQTQVVGTKFFIPREWQVPFTHRSRVGWGRQSFLYLGSGKFPSHTVQFQVLLHKKHKHRMSTVWDKYLFKQKQSTKSYTQSHTQVQHKSNTAVIWESPSDHCPPLGHCCCPSDLPEFLPEMTVQGAGITSP